MRLQPGQILLLVCCSLNGCMSAHPIAISSGNVANDAISERRSKRDFNFDDPAERQIMLASIDHETMGQTIAETPPGSIVSVVVEFDRQFTGTVLNAGQEGVELMNCICKEAVPGPNGQLQCKTSHLPLQSFKTSSMTRFSVISPPPEGFTPPDITEDTSGLSVAEIVFKDGRRQQLWSPPSAH